MAEEDLLVEFQFVDETPVGLFLVGEFQFLGILVSVKRLRCAVGGRGRDHRRSRPGRSGRIVKLRDGILTVPFRFFERGPFALDVHFMGDVANARRAGARIAFAVDALVTERSLAATGTGVALTDVEMAIFANPTEGEGPHVAAEHGRVPRGTVIRGRIVVNRETVSAVVEMARPDP